MATSIYTGFLKQFIFILIKKILFNYERCNFCFENNQYRTNINYIIFCSCSCVVLGDSFYFAVLLPVALILFVNLVVLIMVMRSLINKSKSRISSTQRQTGKVQARIALACSTLLGLTWVLALLAVGDLRYTFQLLFTIFNSLQGFFIFLFYTVMNKEVQKEWKSVLNIGSKTDSTTNSSQPVTTTLPKSKVYLNEGKGKAFLNKCVSI